MAVLWKATGYCVASADDAAVRDLLMSIRGKIRGQFVLTYGREINETVVVMVYSRGPYNEMTLPQQVDVQQLVHTWNYLDQPFSAFDVIKGQIVSGVVHYVAASSFAFDPIDVGNFPAPTTHVSVDNFPTPPTHISVDNFPSGFMVNNWPATFPVINYNGGKLNVNADFPGEVSISNFPSVYPVKNEPSGVLQVSGGGTVVPNPLPVTIQSPNPLPISGNVGVSGTVSISGTIPVNIKEQDLDNVRTELKKVDGQDATNLFARVSPDGSDHDYAWRIHGHESYPVYISGQWPEVAFPATRYKPVAITVVNSTDPSQEVLNGRVFVENRPGSVFTANVDNQGRPPMTVQGIGNFRVVNAPDTKIDIETAGISISNWPVSQNVTVQNFPATQPISGSVSITSIPQVDVNLAQIHGVNAASSAAMVNVWVRAQTGTTPVNILEINNNPLPVSTNPSGPTTSVLPVMPFIPAWDSANFQISPLSGRRGDAVSPWGYWASLWTEPPTGALGSLPVDIRSVSGVALPTRVGDNLPLLPMVQHVYHATSPTGYAALIGEGSGIGGAFGTAVNFVTSYPPGATNRSTTSSISEIEDAEIIENP